MYTEGLCSVMKVVFCFILACLLTGCLPGLSGKNYLERWATIEEAFPSQLGCPQIIPEMPAYSYNKVVFDAPYADVFRAVWVAVTQAGQNIESSDKSKGLILATKIEWHPPNEVHRYYATCVKELTSKTTEVVFFAKVQGTCVGCLDKDRERLATLHGMNYAPEVSQVVNFTRNNLIAAGVL